VNSSVGWANLKGILLPLSKLFKLIIHMYVERRTFIDNEHVFNYIGDTHF